MAVDLPLILSPTSVTPKLPLFARLGHITRFRTGSEKCERKYFCPSLFSKEYVFRLACNLVLVFLTTSIFLALAVLVVRNFSGAQ